MDRADIINVLKTVKYPGYSRDIVSFGLVGNISIDNNKITITMKYTTQQPHIQEEIEKNMRERLKSVNAGWQVEIKRELQQHGMERPVKRKVEAKHIIAVASGKGGVGKSSVTAILGIGLSHLNYKVGILDADVYGPSIPLILGIHDVPTLGENNKISIPLTNNIKVISIGLLVPETEAVIWRGPMIYKALEQFLFDADWGSIDFLLVDLPPGTGDAPLSLAQLTSLDGVVVVSTPQRASVDVAKKAIFMFNKMQIPILGIIENMSYFTCDNCNKKHFLFGTGLVENISKNLNIPFLGKIPIDPLIIDLADKGNLFSLEKVSPLTYKEYLNIIQNIVKTVKKSRNFLSSERDRTD